MHGERFSRVRLLVVDDDAAFARTLQILLEDEPGYSVEVAYSGAQALEVVERRPSVRVVICDLAMPGMDGLELLRRLCQGWPGIAVILMTAHSTIETAVEAIKLGAFQYLKKPVEPDELLVQVERALGLQRLEQEHRLLRERTGDPARFDVLVGSSPGMEALRATIQRLAPVDSTVLLRGETGTGKELVARLIHAAGPRAANAFVVVNCTAIPGDLLESELFGHVKGAFTGATAARTGRIEQADGGTLLLDEVGDMPVALQPKLLRFLQEKRVQRVGSSNEQALDVRVIAATHRDLEAALRDGAFRDDLFHRLDTIPVTIPPLRDRLSDLPELCRHLLAKIAERLGRPAPALSAESLERLAGRSFSGNVRELENLLERSLVLGGTARTGAELHLLEVTEGPRSTIGETPLELPLADGLRRLQELTAAAERDLIRRAVAAWPDESNSEIARRLGTRRRVLERRMKDYGIAKRG